MRLRDPELLKQYMESQDYTQARLARHSRRSRQFIYKLVHGHTTTCSAAVAGRIEESLRVLPGTLFIPEMSPTTDTTIAKARTSA